ncbi:hypothetical protein J1770_gp76 [Gordonia phage EMoore]|uniref:Uncharacterized protein n=1 Tax=Gordonia phage EMoore TaxID=2656534 RepID=A0A649VUB9_9CAUD|nr:hypothetical protein J1770_gp76 [Gordonia phage EMoore]QGJ95861.1 hypothetical protein SEA_EMOORE_76 [Gordonia phage EMoore]
MIRCDYCGKQYPRQPHDTRCPAFPRLSHLEDEIVRTIQAHAAISLPVRRLIARQLIADGWRPR